MAKDWDRYKIEIRTLYLAKGKTLDEVRRILKGRHLFDASVRSYRMKLEEWGIRKNKVANQRRPRRPSKQNTRHRPPFGARSSNVVSESLSRTNLWSSGSEPVSQVHGDWTQSHNVPPREGPTTGNTRAVPIESFPAFSPDQDLHAIIQYGTEAQVSVSLSSGIPVNTRDVSNNTPLHTAVLRGYINIVKSLLNYGADIDAIGFRWKTPLHLAVASKSLLKLLLKHRPNLSLQDDQGNSILHCLLLIQAWWEDDEMRTILKRILSSGADVNLTNNSGDTPLHLIVANLVPGSDEYLNFVFEFLKCKPDVLSPMRSGSSLLAVFLDNSEILVKRSYSNYEDTGFNCLEKFLNAGANPNVPFRSMPLLDYCLKFFDGGRLPDFVKILLQKADIDSARPSGSSPLHLALARKQFFNSEYDTVASLLTRKANVNQKNTMGASALEFWMFRNTEKFRTDVALLLVEAGADTTIITSTGESLFDYRYFIPEADRSCLTRAFLKADINNRQGDDETTPRVKWIELWRSTWKQTLWCLAKSLLKDLEDKYPLPNNEEFHECAFVVIAEHLLEKHRIRLELRRVSTLSMEAAKEEYCAILRDCRERKAEIKTSWYTYLLDLMDID